VSHISDFGFQISDLGSGVSFLLPCNRQSEIGNPKSKGFTLLEVMIAVAILAMVLISLLGLKNRSMQDVMRAERITTATLLAKRLMTDPVMTKQQVGEEEGVFPEEIFKDYQWKKTVSPTPITVIKEVRVAVLWKEGERFDMVELVSYE